MEDLGRIFNYGKSLEIESLFLGRQVLPCGALILTAVAVPSFECFSSPRTLILERHWGDVPGTSLFLCFCCMLTTTAQLFLALILFADTQRNTKTIKCNCVYHYQNTEDRYVEINIPTNFPFLVMTNTQMN